MDRPPCCNRSWPGHRSSMRLAPSVRSNQQADSGNKCFSRMHLRIARPRSNRRPGLGSTPRCPGLGTRCTDCRPPRSRRRRVSPHRRRSGRSRPPGQPPRPRLKSGFLKDSASLPFSNVHCCLLSNPAATAGMFVTSGVLYCVLGCRVRVKIRTLSTATEDVPLSLEDDVRHKRARMTRSKIL